MKKLSLPLLISVIVISLFGLIMIYSASNIWAEYKFNDPFKYVKNQGLFLIIGIIVMIIVSKIDYKIYMEKSNLILFGCLILLILVLIPGIGTVRNGSRSWFGIGSFGIQPSEFAKLGMIIFTSKYLTNNDKAIKNIKGILPILILTLLMFGLIMLQPDFGTGLVILLSCFCFLFLSGANYKIFIIIGIIGILGIGVLIVSAPYRFERILAYLDPWSDPLGSGFQGIQSLFAITPGGLFGHGFNNSIQKHFFLPEPQNDFIFAIIIEEFGLIGGIIVILLYFMIIYRCFKISKNIDNNFCKFLLLGLSLTLAIQVFINMGVVIGLLPVTGITLPLFSYGGSSLLINYISFGFILNSSKYRNL